MKRLVPLLFPLLFGLFALLCYFLIILFRADAVEWRIAALIFCAALAWSPLIRIPEKRAPRLKLAYALFSLAAALFLVERTHVPSESLSEFRIIFLLILLGVVLIQLFFLIQKRKGKS